MASSKVEKRPAVDPHDEPSAEWGWHGGFPRAARIGAGFIVVACLAMLIGNQKGHVEDVYLIGVAILVVVGLVVDAVRRRTAWRR